MRVCLTGSHGFIGRALLCALGELKVQVIQAVRSVPLDRPDFIGQHFVVGNIGTDVNWVTALAGTDCVIHCAARAHVMRETEANPLALYRMVNVEATRRLAEQAVVAGVKRVVFLSSIGVLGVHTNSRSPFSLADVPGPVDD